LLGGWGHLAARFLAVLRAPPLTEVEKDEAREWLHAPEIDLFFSQPDFDQRHGLESARYMAALRNPRLDLIRSALLHDVGKRHARMGPIVRSLVSGWSKLGGKTTGGWRGYLDHGLVAARELSEIGAEPLVIEFALHHHGDRPDSIREEDWALLQQADKARR
jgi:hypothetical protein